MKVGLPISCIYTWHSAEPHRYPTPTHFSTSVTINHSQTTCFESYCSQLQISQAQSELTIIEETLGDASRKKATPAIEAYLEHTSAQLDKYNLTGKPIDVEEIDLSSPRHLTVISLATVGRCVHANN